ncbi:hypothetical protein Ga0100231_021955 [Opitutaceae bacterium TAV4]|uniref:hypothetical protein n=1 Tax=Geminisphaera colitermitum TaxID=1148786 RepID=UPI000F629CBE|nr:hypothetical protein [Geminisphaera colitermitum]RRJ96508.1 hypothetical protein Ga0100231_021955 [Opitutaceae bacterium TAV4]
MNVHMEAARTALAEWRRIGQESRATFVGGESHPDYASLELRWREPRGFVYFSVYVDARETDSGVCVILTDSVGGVARQRRERGSLADFAKVVHQFMRIIFIEEWPGVVGIWVVGSALAAIGDVDRIGMNLLLAKDDE